MTRLLVVLGLSLLATSQRKGGVADATATAVSSSTAFVGPQQTMQRLLRGAATQGQPHSSQTSSSTSMRILVPTVRAMQNNHDRKSTTTTAQKDQQNLASMIVPFGESSRQYVRTVYSHSDWIRHRSESRVFRNLQEGLLRPRAWRQLRREVGSVVAVAVFVILWNYIRWDFQLGLPVTPFMMASPALGLLLVFRTNASYGRWCEARAKWGTIINHCTNIMRMSATYVDKSSSDNRLALDQVCRATWALPRTFMNRLAGAEEDADSFEQEIRQAFQNSSTADRTNFAEYVLDESLCPTNQRTSAALLELTMAIDALPVDGARRIEIDKSVVVVNDSIGSCERKWTRVHCICTILIYCMIDPWSVLLIFFRRDLYIASAAQVYSTHGQVFGCVAGSHATLPVWILYPNRQQCGTARTLVAAWHWRSIGLRIGECSNIWLSFWY